MNKPYIVSGDIYPLMKRWAENGGFVLPRAEFVEQLRENFSAFMRRIFSGFEFVPEEELSCGLSELVVQSNLPVVSLDDVYIKSELCLEITRLVDTAGKDKGLGSRAGSPSLLHQLRELVRKLAASDVNEIALVDDVIFTGSLIKRVINLLSKKGIRVRIIYAGIGIAEGIRQVIDSKREIRCVRTYEEVIDEICERDFYPGVPLSGRLLAGSDNVGVPYLFPFGRSRKLGIHPYGVAKTILQVLY